MREISEFDLKPQDSARYIQDSPQFKPNESHKFILETPKFGRFSFQNEINQDNSKTN